MTTKLVQKHFLKGTREFEIIDDVVHVRKKSLFKEERLTLGLSILDPEPVMNKSELEFHGHSRRDALLSLYTDNPDAEEFNAFVDTLRQRILEEYSPVAVINATSQPAGLSGNVYDEPPEFGDFEQHEPKAHHRVIDPSKVDNAIQMLQTYLDANDIKPFLSTLEALKNEPHNETYLRQVVDAFNDLGPTQGAVLTYAPYLGILLSDHLTWDH